MSDYFIDAHLQRLCIAAAEAIDLYACALAVARPGLLLADPAFPNPMSDVEAFPGVSPETYGDPAGSPAEHDAQCANMSDFFNTAGETTMVAVDHLFGTAALLRRGDGALYFAQWATARAAVEALGVLYWLHEPAISPELRVARAINETFLSLTFFRNVGGVNLERDFKAKVKKAGFRVRKGARALYVDEEMPTRTGLVEAMGVNYRTLSTAAHGEKVGRELLVEPVTLPSGARRSEVRAQPRSVAFLVGELAVASTKAARRVAAYSGWGDEYLEEALRRAAARLVEGGVLDAVPNI